MNGTPTAHNNTTGTEVFTNPTTTITPNKRKFKHNILKNLNNEIKANMQYNKQLNSTLNNNISNTTNTSLLSHPDGKKLIENSEKKLGNNKKLYSPSSTQETHRSNNSHLTRTETH